MTILWGITIALPAFWLGIILMGLLAGRKCEGLQDQIDAKRESWCGECRHKLDAAAFDELLLHERRSKYASLREKEKEIQALKVKLYEATRQMGIKHLSENVART